MDLTKILPLVEKVFDFLFPNLNYEIVLNRNIIIKIKNVNPNPYYNPSNFDAEYKVFEKDDETITRYSKWDFFYPLYSYIPEYTKFINIELYPYPLSLLVVDINSPFQIFDLFEQYVNEEKRIMTPNAINNHIY